jgi:hypothetical protein
MTIGEQHLTSSMARTTYSQMMRWTRPANRMLVEAIADSFRGTEHPRKRFAEFRPKDWAQTEFWLDASGLALYFLDHVQSIGIEDAIDPTVIKTLKRKVADNRDRRNDMFEEFLRLVAFRIIWRSFSELFGVLSGDSL